MSRVRQREDVFYRLLDEFGVKLVEMSHLYEEIFENYPDVGGRIEAMHDMEHVCDDCCHGLMVELAQSFITPFDREDIVSLARSMDDIADAMNHVAARLEIFHVNKMHPDALRMSQLTVTTVNELKLMLDYLPDFKKDERVVKQAGAVCRLEDRGDEVYHDALSTLYEDDVNPLHALKWTKLFDKMEDALDSCRDVANVVSGVVIKNA